MLMFVRRAARCRYEGEWLDGKRHGRGECAYASGDLYSGMWTEGGFHGEGRLQLAATAITYEGLFVDGKPSQPPNKLNLFWWVVTAQIVCQPRLAWPSRMAIYVRICCWVLHAPARLHLVLVKLPCSLHTLMAASTSWMREPQ